MTREEVILAAFAPAKGESHSPVQVQKLLFLIERRAAKEVGGKKFEFAAYDYGPFDQSIYADLRALSKAGLVEIVGDQNSKGRRYRLTASGQKQAEGILAQQDAKLQRFLGELSAWVRSLSFAELVSAIYASYPEMKANSVFSG